MDSTLDYMSKLYPTLAKDYREPDGDLASCSQIAVDIAERLLSEDKVPYIVKFEGTLIDRVNTRALSPKQFAGRITWGAHIVCCTDGRAYDPMISREPVPIDDYCQKAFSNDVQMTVWVTKQRIRDFVRIFS